jgi:predicted NBD/HSP70 family sugar kinase
MPRRSDQDGPSPQARLRREHERVILRAITTNEAVSRTQLAADHGLSAQSVGRIVRDLLLDGLIEETSTDQPDGPGAPRIGLRVRADGAYALGFGLERDRLAGVMLDFASNVRWQISRAIQPGQPAIQVLQRIEEDARAALESTELAGDRSRLCGLGIATPGPLDFSTGTIVGAPNFPSWEHADVAKELRRTLDMPVVIDNAATAAAIGTKWQLRRGPTPFLYCYWGLGIGGGLVVDDEAYHGMTGNTMEIGHVVVTPDGRHCDCGGVGCLETEASVTAILNDAARYGEFSTIDEVVAEAAQSEPLSAILTEAAEKMATGLLTVVNLVDVDEIIIGGEHFRAVEHIFLPVIRERLETRAFRRQISPVKVTVCAFEAASAVGAASLVFHTLMPFHAQHKPSADPSASLAAMRASRRQQAQQAQQPRSTS